MAKVGRKPQRTAVVWSPEIAYATGLIATDGCIVTNVSFYFRNMPNQEKIENNSRTRYSRDIDRSK